MAGRRKVRPQFLVGKVTKSPRGGYTIRLFDIATRRGETVHFERKVDADAERRILQRISRSGEAV